MTRWRTLSRKMRGPSKFSFYLEFIASQCTPVLLFKRVFLHHSVHALDMNTIIAFVYLGLQFTWNQLSSKNSGHTSCVHKGLHAGKWPDLMISKTRRPQYTGLPLDRLLEPHWLMLSPSGLPMVIQCPLAYLEHTERPLEPQATGTTLADASSQLYPRGNPVLICIIGTHWINTGRPTKDHCKHAGNTLATSNSFFSGIPVFTGI